MKTKNVILIALFTVFINLKGNAQEVYENRYFIVYVPATFQENYTAYVSDLIYYSNYNECGRDYDFEGDVKDAFSNYLSANYNDIFPYGTQDIMVVKYIEHSTSTYLKSTQQGYDRINALKAEILDYNRGYSGIKHAVILTNFSYSCE